MCWDIATLLLAQGCSGPGARAQRGGGRRWAAIRAARWRHGPLGPSDQQISWRLPVRGVAGPVVRPIRACPGALPRPPEIVHIPFRRRNVIGADIVASPQATD